MVPNSWLTLIAVSHKLIFDSFLQTYHEAFSCDFWWTKFQYQIRLTATTLCSTSNSSDDNINRKPLIQIVRVGYMIPLCHSDLVKAISSFNWLPSDTLLTTSTPQSMFVRFTHSLPFSRATVLLFLTGTLHNLHFAYLNYLNCHSSITLL